MLNDSRRIIISRTDRIGDVVLSLPTFASIKECFPDCELTALVRGYTSDVVSSFGAVDRVVTYDPEESIIATVRKMKRLHADSILFLYPRFHVTLAAFLARIPLRVGTAYRWYSFLFNRKVREHRKDSIKSEAEYNLSLAEAIGCNAKVLDTNLRINEKGLDRVREFLTRNRIDRFVVVHPGSGGSAADWSSANFNSLCKRVSEELQMPVLVSGANHEKDLCAAVSDGVPNCINTAGEFTLIEFIAFLSLASAFVSNSTGPIHLAAATGTPVVGIYPNNKPLTPVRWAPLADKRTILTPSDGSDELSIVTIEEVFQAIRAMLPVTTR